VSVPTAFLGLAAGSGWILRFAYCRLLSLMGDDLRTRENIVDMSTV
jgi:hypothetical protein